MLASRETHNRFFLANGPGHCHLVAVHSPSSETLEEAASSEIKEKGKPQTLSLWHKQVHGKRVSPGVSSGRKVHLSPSFCPSSVSLAN